MKDHELISIKDFSKQTGTRQSVLRYYDEIGVFRPAERGRNGYRYYTKEQISDLNMLGILTKLKTPLREIADLNCKRDPQRILDLLQKQEGILDTEMLKLHESYSIAHTYHRFINEGISVNEKDLTEADMEAMPIFVGKEDYAEFKNDAEKHHINLSYPVGGMFTNMRTFSSNSAHPTNFLSTDPRGNDMKVAGRYLVGYIRGGYGTENDLPMRFLEYAIKNNLEFVGPVYVMYLLNEVCCENSNDYLAQASVMVKNKLR